MDDTISRQAAIESADILFKPFTEYSPGMVDLESIAYNHALADFVVTLNALPSAERRGRWIGERLIYPSGIITFIYRCSECGYEERHAYEDIKPSNYCPNCGAKMRLE